MSSEQLPMAAYDGRPPRQRHSDTSHEAAGGYSGRCWIISQQAVPQTRRSKTSSICPPPPSVRDAGNSNSMALCATAAYAEPPAVGAGQWCGRSQWGRRRRSDATGISTI